MPSQYRPRTSASRGGGRAALTRAAAALGHINLGHFLPDYTAYEELLDIFKAFTAIPILLEGERGYAFTPDDLRREIQGRGLSAVLLSNPCNPTGKLVQGEELARWVAIARELDCALLIDEFYSHYIWTGRPGAAARSRAPRATWRTSNRDPVVLFDGLTKNWRYPGWRVTWTVGPRKVIDAVASAGCSRWRRQEAAAAGGDSAARGGAWSPGDEGDSRGLPRQARPDAAAAGAAGHPHRPRRPTGRSTSGATSRLPAAAQRRHGLLPRGADEKVIAVPGEFFDVNPGKRRSGRVSDSAAMRAFPSAPPWQLQADEALARIERVILSAT